MTRYIMTRKLYNKFKTMGYELVCKICEDCPIHIGDVVESKSSGGSKGPKMYHAECYERFHLDFDEDGTILNGYGEEIEEESDEEEKN